MDTHDRSGFGKDTTADEVLKGIDLIGKTVLVTGGSSGLGAETARALVAKGAHVIITARDLGKAQGVVDGIKAATGRDAIEIEEVELASFASIRAFAGRFLARHDRLDILITNAGIMACPQGRTENGFEQQFGTNHLGHFLLTGLLAPALVKGAPARIVSVSSAGHHFSPVVFEDINFNSRSYEKWSSYGQSKTANVLFAVALNARLKDKGVEAFAIHPGAIMTDLARHLDEADIQRFTAMIESGEMPMKTVECGAATQVFAATAPELDGKGGCYLSDCGICAINDADDDWAFVRSYALDPAAAERLWAMSEDMVGERFPL